MTSLRYSAASIQTDMPNPARRVEMRKSTRRMLDLIEFAVDGFRPFLPVRLVVFPEFAHAAPVYQTASELRKKLAVRIPNHHTDKLCEKARELGIFIQSGSFIESDPKYPNALFNTTCLIGPEGILAKYRKVYPWLPWEVHTSPHDIKDYEEDMFPVADTEIGRLGAAICYDWIFPETLREMALKGAEVLIRVSAYMDPFGATAPMDWWTVVNRCRAIENMCYVVAANQAAKLSHYPPFSWPGGSMIVDPWGRIVTQATPGDGEKIVVGEIDINALRDERRQRHAHQTVLHLRTEAHPSYRRSVYPGQRDRIPREVTYEDNVRLTELTKQREGYGCREDPEDPTRSRVPARRRSRVE